MPDHNPAWASVAVSDALLDEAAPYVTTAVAAVERA